MSMKEGLEPMRSKFLEDSSRVKHFCEGPTAQTKSPNRRFPPREGGVRWVRLEGSLTAGLHCPKVGAGSLDLL